MTMSVSVFTLGSGDLVTEVFNAIASVFNSSSTIGAITHLAILLGGMCAIFQFARARDIQVLMRWAGIYVLVTTLVLYPKATVNIEDRTDLKPRSIDNVPLSLALMASFTTSIGLGMAEMIETVFHMPNDMSYNKTGMLMGSRFVLASQDFQITDPVFSQTLDAFMQQCVFYDLLLNRYNVNDLLHDRDPWNFIKEHTSVARAFPLNNQITICKTGAVQLDAMWKDEMNRAAAIYGAQILGHSNNASKVLLSHLEDGYSLLTQVSEEGSNILKKNMLSNAISQAVSHASANTNAPAALQAFEDTKTELQIRHTLDLTGRQAGYWLQQIKNIFEAVMYGSFIFVYFLSYFPFGIRILNHYLFGLFYLQTLSPMFAIVNFAATFYAQNRSILFSTQEGLSMANMAGITQANADAMALAGYLSWIVALGGGMMLYRGWAAGIQSAGQYFGGVAQNAATHVASDAISGNISVGNTSFANQSLFNTNANHFDANARHASGMVSLQTSTGSTVSIAPDGREILNTNGSISNLPVDVRVAESLRMSATDQYQSNYTAALNNMQGSTQQYATAIRQLSDVGSQSSHFENSGSHFSETNSSGLTKSASEVHNIMESFRKEHHLSHDKTAQLFAEVYADAHVGAEAFGNGGRVGASARLSGSARSSFGSLYNQAEQYAKDHHFTDAVDTARRDSKEIHYRVSDDQGNRYSQSIAQSFDKGDSYRKEALSSYSKAESYANLASTTAENSHSINANYTQDFYQWMKSQPAVYGQGTMSRSMIDNMNVAELQSYADRYSQEKAGSLISEFNHSHHLENGKSEIVQAYHRDNQSVGNASHVKEIDSHHRNKISQNQQHINTGLVSDEALQAVNKNIENDKENYTHRSAEDTLRGTQLEDHTREKIKGRVLEGFNPVIKGEKWIKEKIEHE